MIFLLLFSAVAAAQPLLESSEVFRQRSGGYHTFRIPALVEAADASLVAFAEARRDNRGDPGLGDIDLVTARSEDQGKTWSAITVLDNPGEKWSASNPTPLLDRTNGRLWIFYNRWEPGYGTELARPGTTNNQMWARFSDDHGKTWSEARDLTQASRVFEHWGAMFLGPGGAVQLRNGRLVLPAAMKYDAYYLASAGAPLLAMQAYVLYSDDHGQSWQRGALAAALTNENQVVELDDGTLLMDARQNSGEHRWLLWSRDGGRTWSKAQPGQTVTAIATGIERLAANTLVWSGPAGPGRRRLVTRLSRDGGLTWRNERTIYGGWSAYSDLALLRDGTLGILWEKGVSEGYESISFTRVNRDFLEAPRD